MMAEYIEKESLYREIAKLEELARKRVIDTPPDSPAYVRYLATLNERTNLKHKIADAPAADVAPVVHGRWTEYGVCNQCGCDIPAMEDSFCPDCGAKMDGYGRDDGR